MKKYLLLMMALAILPLFTSCSKDEETQEENKGSATETIKIALEVTDIADNQATINISLSSGNFYGAKLVEAIESGNVPADYTNEIKLISFVEENGVDITLPYTNTLTGLRAGEELFTAVIVYGSNGVAATSEYKFWTAVGDFDVWSEDNDAGSLAGDIEW